MIDGQGRTIEYLRISVTDRCNLRCKYCMPEGGVDLMPHEEILSLEEIARIVRILAPMGLKKVRLTGGEPMIRKNLTKLVRDIAKTPGIETVAMTTNGVLFADRVMDFMEAGLTHVNISLDTMNADTFSGITGKNEYGKVLKSIVESQKAGLTVKINCVPCREFNEKDLVNVATLARDYPVDVRFIELMPIGCGVQFTGIPGDEVLELLSKVYGKAKRLMRGSVDGPANYVQFEGFQGRIGLINPMSHQFCSQCNRIRLTADGRLKLCLYHKDGMDLKKLLREGSSDEVIKGAIESALLVKPEKHQFGNQANQDTRKMSQIGG